MLEWLKRHAWKACKLQKGFRGSNPRLSAKILRRAVAKVYFQTRIDAKALNKVPAAACGDYEEIPGGEVPAAACGDYEEIIVRAVRRDKKSPAEKKIKI